MFYKLKPVNIWVGSKEFGNIKKAVGIARETKALNIIFTWNSSGINAEEFLEYIKSNLYAWVGLYGCNFSWEINDREIIMSSRSDIRNRPVIE